jgi:hypothetical protein
MIIAMGDSSGAIEASALIPSESGQIESGRACAAVSGSNVSLRSTGSGRGDEALLWAARRPRHAG